MKQFLSSHAPGLITAGALALLAMILSGFTGLVGAAVLALILGIIFGNSGIRFYGLEKGLNFTEKRILEAAIVLIGFGMNIKIFAALGVGAWFFVIASLVPVVFVAIIIGRWFGLSFKLGILLGAGSAICGSAAIGAIAPLLNSKEEETGLSIGVINVLSTLGLILLPLLSGLLAMSVANSGLIIGGVLQSMGHVVGAGFALGEEVGTAATVVKMGRVSMIVPLMLIILLMTRKHQVKGKKMKLPLFIPLFALALILAQLPFFPQVWTDFLAGAGNFLLIMAMVAIGFKIKFKPLFSLAGAALATGLAVFAFQIMIYLLYLYI